MKLLFIQLRFESSMSVMCLSSYLNLHGHQTDVLIVEGESDLIGKIKEIRPAVIGFSASTVDIQKLLAINRILKETNDFFSIFGGPQPTFFPEVIEQEPTIDAICIGEGERALLELLNNLKNHYPIDNIANLYLRKNGQIIKNRLRPLIEDLDQLPFLNKDIYRQYYHNPYLLKNVPIRFLSSRGCPYDCTYCFNHKFFELYGTSGKRIRKRGVDSLIQEIKEVKEKFDIPMVSFVDDLFTSPKLWVQEFAEKYKKEINLPYSINTRVNAIDEEICSWLEKSGCYYVGFSIESGDDYLRNKVLNRNMSEGQIINTANLLHKYQLPFCTGNMLGVPGETMATLMKTVEINRQCRPHYAWASLFQPFPKLNLTRYSIEHGYFDGDFSKIGEDQFTDSPLNLSRKQEIVRFHKFFALLIRYPIIAPLVKLLIKIPLNRFYNWIFRKYKIRYNDPIIKADQKKLKRQWKSRAILKT